MKLLAGCDNQLAGKEVAMEYEDPIYPDVLQWVKAQKTATITQIQRAFRLGWNRSAHLVERMQREGLVTGPDIRNRYRVPVTEEGDL